MAGTVRLEIDGPVATITNDNPDKHNAFDDDMDMQLFAIIDDAARMWELGISVFERYNEPYTDEMKPFVEAMLRKRVVVKLHVDKTVTWDHRKLGLPSM